MAATYADEAFERLYTRYGREVYRYALALLRNPTEAEDVTQTTFLNAYRALRAGERPRRPHNWLIAIAHNVCRSRVRFAMRRPKEVPLEDVVEQLAVAEAERPNIRELLRTIRRLPFNQRAAITMRELEGRSYVDIAESLGVTVPAAEALIGRARRTLRSHAAAFRSLLLVPLPRSLRKLAENGEAAGGAVGTATAVKVAALLAVGAVGGGVGAAAGSGSQLHPASVEHGAGQTPAPAAQAATGRRIAARASGAASSTPRVNANGYPIAGTGGRPRIARAEDTAASAVPPPAAPAPTTPPAATPGSTASGTVAGTSATAAAAATAATTVASTAATATQAITTAVPQLPAATTPSATTPPVTTPTLSIPVTTVPPLTAPTVTVPPIP
jgi:RNA polymerase sigma factor (sigma-70 family)